MVWPFKSKQDNKKLIVSVSGDTCRLLLLESGPTSRLLSCDSFTYDNLEHLQQHIAQWQKRNHPRVTHCRWVLARDIYQSLLIDKPDVAPERINDAARWLVKDQLQHAVDETIVAHYTPLGAAQREGQINLIAVQRALIEKIVAVSQEQNWLIENISVEELCTGYALQSHLNEEKRIYGFIGADREGLIFNFYRGRNLTFSRFIRGRLLPVNADKDAFTLDIDDEQARDTFLLEVQRTIDYATNQVFREPPTQLILQGQGEQAEQLAKMVSEMTDIPCELPQIKIEDARDNKNIALVDLLPELGVFMACDETQSIDLYLDEFKPQPLTFNSVFAAYTTAALIVLAIAFGVWQEHQLTQLENRKLAAENRYKQLQEQFERSEQSLAQLQESDNSSQLLAQKQAELLALNKIVSQLKRRELQNEIPYSAILHALEALDLKRIWLTEIVVDEGVLSLKGSTTRREQIPRYIEALSMHKPLKRKFAEMHIEQDSQRQNLYHFDLKNGALIYGS